MLPVSQTHTRWGARKNPSRLTDPSPPSGSADPGFVPVTIAATDTAD